MLTTSVRGHVTKSSQVLKSNNWPQRSKWKQKQTKPPQKPNAYVKQYQLRRAWETICHVTQTGISSIKNTVCSENMWEAGSSRQDDGNNVQAVMRTTRGTCSDALKERGARRWESLVLTTALSCCGSQPGAPAFYKWGFIWILCWVPLGLHIPWSQYAKMNLTLSWKHPLFSNIEKNLKF